MDETARFHIRTWKTVQLQTGHILDGLLESGAEQEGAGTPEGAVHDVRIGNVEVEQLEGG